MHHEPAITGRALSERTLSPRALVAAVLAVVMAAVGCQAAPPSPSVAPQSPSASAPGATEPPSSPAASPSASGIAAREVSGSRAELPPGRYTRRGFVPRITFELDGPWHSVNALNGFFDVQQDVGSPDVIAVQFARPDQVYAAPDGPAHVVKADAAVDILKANPALEVLESSDSLMSGLAGFVVEVENPPTAAAHVQVLRVPPGALGIDPGRRLWIAFFDTPDGLLAIMIGGSVAKWDEALTAAEPVLESVTIGQ